MSKSVAATPAPPQAERSAVARPASPLAVSPTAVMREGLGNRAFGAFLQARLAASGPGDGHEPDANSAAGEEGRALELPPPPPASIPPPPPDPAPVVRRQSGPHEEDEDSTGRVVEVQRKCATCEEEEEQAASAGGPTVQRACAACEEEAGQAGTGSGPSVQRTCAACEEEDGREGGVAVQAKVIVGPADDPFEREADTVAARVMRMSIDPPVGASAAGAHVQRACAACEREDDGRAGRQRRAIGPKGGSARISPETLTAGGEGLPSSVRGFFEPRFGRDLSRVRLHTGEQAADTASRLGAYAFTYASHIWLGRGQSAEANELIAHELAHVVQQTSPEAHTSGAAVQTAAAPVVQRFGIPYFEPGDVTGPRTHSRVLPRLRASRGRTLLSEAPIPDGNERGVGPGHPGRADLYIGDAISGIQFVGHNTPATLGAAGLRVNGTLASASGGATGAGVTVAPNYSSRLATITDVARAPSEVKVGDLKPIGERAFMGRNQVLNYVGGLEHCRTFTNQVPSTNRDGTWPPLSANPLAEPDLDIPAEFQPPFSGQTPRSLVLKEAQWGSASGVGSRPAWIPNPPIQGHLCVRVDPTHAGIFNHFWVPTSVPHVTLPPQLTRLPAQVRAEIINPLLIAPVSAQPKRPSIDVTPERAPVLRRRAPRTATVNDPFVYADWRRNLTRITQTFTQEGRTPEGRQTEGRIRAMEAVEFLRRRSGLSTGLPAVSSAGAEAARDYKQLDFWTGASAQPFGLMRNVFGRAFVTVARVYLRARDRFREILRRRRMRASAPSGALGAAIKAAFNVLKLALRFLAAQVVDRLWDSLSTGVEQKLRSLVPEEVTDAINEQLARVEEVKQQIERSVIGEVERTVEELIRPYEEQIEELQRIHDIVSDLATIVNLVRWGARVLACLSPPAFGCLWILAEVALDRLIAVVVETCWFQRHITPMLARVDFIRRAPQRLADLIVQRVRGMLPESMRDVFAVLPEMSANVRPEDIECEESGGEGSGGEGEMTAERAALLRLQERIGDEDKLAALAELSRASGADRGAQLTAADIDAIAAAVQNTGVTAAQMREWAANFATAGGRTPTDFQRFFQQMVDRRQPGTPQPATPIPTPTVPEPPPPPAEPSAGAPGASQPTPTPAPGQTPTPSTGVAGEDGGGTVQVFTADQVAYDGPSGDASANTFDIVNASSAHTLGTRASLTFLGYRGRQAISMVTGVEAVVVRRTYFPRGSAEGNATHLVIHYRIERGFRLPGSGVITTGRVICFHLGRGGQSSLSPARRCP